MSESVARGRGQPTLRFGYWMQFWGACFALWTVYPNPGLTVLTGGLLVVLASLIASTRPTYLGGRGD